MINLARIFGLIGRLRSKPRLSRCPICRGPWVSEDKRGNQECAQGHRFGPDQPRGELFNEGEHRGDL